MVHFTPLQEGDIVDIKCLYYQNSLDRLQRPLGPSDAITEGQRYRDSQLFLGKDLTNNFLCFICASDICGFCFNLLSASLHAFLAFEALLGLTSSQFLFIFLAILEL